MLKIKQFKFPLTNHLLRNYNVAATKLNENKINKVLIANRGEIAVRIIRTAKRLGIRCVAVYSEADKNSMHVNLADEAYYIGPAPSNQSYLNQDKILEVAAKSKADAIHPGYGFLSENYEFANLCAKNNIIFIGPSENSIRDMGVKSTSKNIMSKANVPIIPGYHGENQDSQFLLSEAKKLGFPIMIKAVRGGGGKGMRICLDEKEFFEKLESAKNEALKSFKNDEMLIEKYIQRPRHIEVQVFGDQHGNYIYLFERDCSVQRRHQKIIEEAPAPGLDENIRNKLGEAAVSAAKAVDYIGAGTVEFVFDSDTNEFYFMEMNTRLQVEHPITEMITKTDLVEMQFSVANGNELLIKQDDLKIHGHSFEARIYAEDPSNEFLPISGRITHLIEPKGENVRVETGVRNNDEVSVYYDPMVAKLVVWSENRNTALKKLINQLSNYKILGLKTNIPFLMKLASHREFMKGNVYTNFIPDFYEDLFSKGQLDKRRLAQLAIGLVFSELDPKKIKSLDPFQQVNSFRNLGLNQKTSSFNLINPDTKEEIKIEVDHKSNQKFDISINGEKFANLSAKFDLENNEIQIDFDGFKSKFSFLKDKNTVSLFKEGEIPLSFELKLPNYLISSSEASSNETDIISPMPGVLEKVLVKEGQDVKKGETLAVIIAMKMEYQIKSNKDQKVDKIMYKAGDNVAKGAKLISFVE